MDYKAYLKSESIRNVSTLVAGTGIAQAIALAISPILSRIFNPEDFGVWAIFIAVTGVFGVIASLRYEMAIVLPKEDEDACAVVWLSLMINVVISIVLLLLVLLFGKAFSSFMEIPSFYPWLFLTPLAVFLMGVYNSFNYWTTRQRRYTLNSAARITQTAGTAGVNLGVGSLTSGATGLILGQVFGLFCATFFFVLRSLKIKPELRRRPSNIKLKEVAAKYRNFPLVNTPHAFLSTMQDSGIVFVIKYFFSTAILGSYSFAFRILKAPVGLIGSAVFQVFFQKASKASSQGERIRPMMWRLHKNLFLIGLPPFVLLFFYAPQLFAFVFSEPYRQAGEIAQIFTPWLFLNFLMSPLSSITLVKNRQEGAFLITIIDVSFRVAAIAYGGITGDYMFGFVLMSASCSMVLIGAMLWYYRIADAVSGEAY